MDSRLREGWARSPERAPVIARPCVLLVRGPSPCTVRLKVVPAAECLLRGLLGISHPPVSTGGWAGGLRAGWAVSCRLQGSRRGPPQVLPWPGGSSKPLPIAASATRWPWGFHGTRSWGPGHCLAREPKEPEGRLSPGCLAPSVMMAGQALGPWLKGAASWDLPPQPLSEYSRAG